MTPEERLNRIEQALDRQIAFVAEQNERIQNLIASDEKQNEGIRALIVVVRTCLDSIQEMRVTHDSDHRQVLAVIKELREAQSVTYEKLREAQSATDEKLNILITTVDRIVGHRPQ
jgi:hypothetical protein